MTNLLQQITGCDSWESFITEKTSNDETLKELIAVSYNDLINWNNPKEMKMAIAFHSGTNKPTFLMGESEESLKFSSPTSYVSLLARCKANVINKESPIDLLNREGDQIIKSIFIAYLKHYNNKEKAREEVEENLLFRVIQYIQSRKLRVNSFSYWRVRSFMYNKIQRAIEFINRNDENRDNDAKTLVGICGCYDPTAGWGCRMVSFLLIKVYLLNTMIDSGKYSESQLNEFRNAKFYMGCDTNLDLQPMYKRLIKVISEMYGISDSAEIKSYDCISPEGLNYAKTAINNGINLLFTSPPTPLECYSTYETDSVNQFMANGDSQDWINGFLVPFCSKLVAMFCKKGKCAAIHIDGYTTSINNRKEKVDLGKIICVIFNQHPLSYPGFSEIAFAFDEKIRDPKCKCNKNKCGKCESCLQYGYCFSSTFTCKRPNCNRVMSRSCYVIGNHELVLS